MRIAFTHNLKVHDTIEEAEFDTPDTVEAISTALRSLGHEVVEVDVSGPASRLVARLEAIRPDMVFNTAEGRHGRYREAFYPALFEQLRLPFTGSDAYVCAVTLDKAATKRVVAAHGVPTPFSTLITHKDDALPQDLRFPLILKPNFEGSSKGVTQDSIVEDRKILEERLTALLEAFPSGILVEEYIEGIDVTVPWLAGVEGGVLDVASYEFHIPAGRYAIYDYELKNHASDSVHVRVPARIPSDVAARISQYAASVVECLGVRDMARADFRVTPDGEIYFIEINALPSLEPGASIYECAKTRGLPSVEDVLASILRTAAERQNVIAGERRSGDKLRVGLTHNVKRADTHVDDRDAEYDAPTTIEAIRNAIASFGHEVVLLEATPDLLHTLPASDVDLVFNIAEGLRGRNREAQVPAILELLDVEYTGSDPSALAVTLDKALAKRLVREAGVPTAPFALMRSGHEPLPESFRFPAVVKPNAEGSSKGVTGASVVRTEDELRRLAAQLIERYEQPVLAESFLPGREFTIGVLGDLEPKVLPPMEIAFGPGSGDLPVYAYEHKQDSSDAVRYVVPAPVSAELGRDLAETALAAFEALGCRDVARIDVRCDEEGRPHFIECNPLPGLTPEWSDLCMIGGAAGMSYESLILAVMTPALRRLRTKRERQALNGAAQ